MSSIDTEFNQELLQVLKALIIRWEKEIVEFKEAKVQFDTDRLGRYFSAISNEANLKNQQFGWLIFGVREVDRKIVGTQYKNTNALEKLKNEIAAGTTDGISFLDIFEVYVDVEGKEERVLMFKIPAAITAMPTGWKNRYYGRAGESLTPLTQSEIDIIRGQRHKDWSKQLIPNSSVANLDKEAIQIAREKYKGKKKQEHISQEVDAMSDEVFLIKLRLMDRGLLTNAAMILLGNPDHKHLIQRPPTVMWRLFGGAGDNRDYEIFELPFITVGDRIFGKLRNLTYRYMPNQRTLFPIETMQYDQSMIYELLNNCMAHEEYELGARIYVDEYEDRIKFINPGTFMPGDIRAVLNPSYAPPFYKNQLLTETMANLGMIDTATMGIRKVFEILRKKFFPMPDYEIDHNQVKVTVYGKVLDINYTRLLFDHPNFDLNMVFLLDAVQKGMKITAEESRQLRKMELIEGKMPSIYLSSGVAQMLDEKERYIKNKAFDDQYYKDLILEYIRKFGKANKKNIRELLMDKLPDVLDEKQKEYKIGNLISGLKREEKIETNTTNQQKAFWILAK